MDWMEPRSFSGLQLEIVAAKKMARQAVTKYWSFISLERLGMGKNRNGSLVSWKEKIATSILSGS